jgi:outer membrane lipoprotein-sorting protein
MVGIARSWMARFPCVVSFVLCGLMCWPLLVSSSPVDPHAVIQRMATSYDRIDDYTAFFFKRERVNGTLLPLEEIELRFQEPFKIYMAWRKPYAGRIITYVEGENNNKIQVNPGGILGFMRLSLDPSSPLATRNSHHTILEAGLRNTIDLIMQQYRLGTREGQGALFLRGHQEIDNRSAYHIELLCHAGRTAGCYAYRGEIWVDKEYYLPIRLDLYDWNNQLYAHYEYRDLRLNPGLGPEAFRLPAVEQIPPSTTAGEEYSDS